MPAPNGFPTFFVRVTAVHAVTYTIAGLIASNLFDYEGLWQTEAFANHRPFDSPWIALGPSLQVLRGVVFATVLWPFREVLLDRPGGARRLWALLVGVGILSTYAASMGSIEGLLYTRTPLLTHLRGLPEVVAQAGAFSWALVAWYRHPHRAWGVVFGVLFALVLTTGVLGLLFGGGQA